MKCRQLAPLILTVILYYSCSQPKENKERNAKRARQSIIIDIPKKIFKDEESCFKIFFKSKDFKLERAYFDCFNEKIDTVNKIILGCNKKLQIEKDTIGIYLEPKTLGRNDFKRIRLLYSDSYNNFSFLDTTFFFVVVERASSKL